jgi:hypothetical protein
MASSLILPKETTKKRARDLSPTVFIQKSTLELTVDGLHVFTIDFDE